MIELVRLCINVVFAKVQTLEKRSTIQPHSAPGRLSDIRVGTHYFRFACEHPFLHETGPEQRSHNENWTIRLVMVLRVFWLPWEFMKTLTNT